MINLLPVAERRARHTDQLNYYTLMGGISIAIGAICLAGVLLVFDQIYRLNLEQLKTQKVAAEGQAALYLDVEKKATSLEKQLESLKKAQGQTTRWATLLTELQTLTPPTVSVKSVKFVPSGTASTGAAPAASPPDAGKPAAGTSAKTDLVGTAENRRSLGQFQIALSQSKIFKNVEIQSSNQKGATGGVVDYKITMEVDYGKLNGPTK